MALTSAEGGRPELELLQAPRWERVVSKLGGER